MSVGKSSWRLAKRAGFLRRHAPKVIVALLLTFSSGVVDITGYLGIFHYFTAHLTGTTVQLGHAFAVEDWTEIWAALAILGGFLCGSLFGRTLIEIGSRRKIRKIASWTLSVEALLLLSLTLGHLPNAPPGGALALLAAAMGIQTATLTRIGSLTVHTTFVTGMVNKLAQLLSHVAFRAYDLATKETPQPQNRRLQRRDVQMVAFLTCVWLSYVAGAVFGSVSFRLWGLRSLLVAVGLLLLGVMTDQFWPLSIKEEQEQSEE